MTTSQVQQRGQELVPSSSIEFKPLNYDRYEDLMDQISNENLIEFIKHRAHEYKKQLLQKKEQILKEQEDISEMIFELEKMVKEKEAKVKSIYDKRKIDETTIASIKKQNEEIQEKIAAKKAKLAEKQEPRKKIEEGLHECQKDITAELLKKVSQYFEKNSNEAGVYVLEALIGLMRGIKKADNYSVELYLKKHEGFMMGMNRIDPKAANPQYAQEHLNALQEKYDKVLKSEEFALFRPFRNVLSKLCMLILISKDEAAIEDSIEEKEKQIAKNNREIEMKEVLLSNVDLHESIKEDCHYYKNVQLKTLVAGQKRVDAEIKDIEKKLENFEEEYFKDM